jgi:two-component system sensor kinase FixL
VQSKPEKVPFPPELSREGDPRRLAQLVDTCQDAVIFIDGLGTILLANPATCRMFGYESAELEGKDVRILMAEPYSSQHRSYVEHFERTGEKRAIGKIRQVSAMRRGGEEFPIELSVTQLAEGSDQVRYGAFIRDVSEKVRLHGQLMERERAATVGTTASMLVHEIGNPLNNMALQLQALRRRVMKIEGGAESATKVDACLSEIERLSRLVQEFRALSSRRRIDRHPVKLTEVVESVLSNLLRISRGISIVREFGDDRVVALADSDKVQQVILNLIHNAVEAMPAGGTLTIRTSRDEKDYCLEVNDTGDGIPENLDVFEPFVTSKPDGTGLGLAICSEIVREHQGSLTFETKAGEGTTFRMKIPLTARQSTR